MREICSALETLLGGEKDEANDEGAEAGGRHDSRALPSGAEEREDCHSERVCEVDWLRA